MSDPSPFDLHAAAARCLLQKLESLSLSGLTHLGRLPLNVAPLRSPTPPAAAVPPPATPTKIAPAAAKPLTPKPTALKPVAPKLSPAPVAVGSWGPKLPADERQAALDIIQREVVACTRCAELASHRTQTVFGVGNITPRLVFCGEAPGADEDRRGEPFVGEAGQLLNKIITACTLRREDVYILNVLKCRPPGNRNPADDEIANCRHFLDRQLSILQPEYICCLGTYAAKTLLNTTTSIGRLRGKFHEYQGVPVLCTYHPAYLLRNPSAKKQVWEDMKLLLQALGIDWTKGPS